MADKLANLEAGDDDHRPITASSSGPMAAFVALYNHPEALSVTTYVLVWYILGALAAITTKDLIRLYPYPMAWSSIQFLTSYWSVYTLLYFQGKRKPTAGTTFEIAYTTTLNTFGFVFMNTSLLYVTAPFVELMRAMEPISTMVLGHAFLHERPSLRCLFTLVPTCGGVAMCCNNTAAFSMLGFIILCASNCCFSGRVVAARHLQNRYPDGMEPYNLFADASLYGLIILVPITMYMEGKVLHEEALALTWDPYEWFTFLALAAVRCLSMAVVNLLSFVVLAKTDIQSFSIISVFRRVVAVVVSAAYFSVPLNSANLLGMATSIAGVLMYIYFKFLDK